MLRHFLNQLVHALHFRRDADKAAESRPAFQLLAQQAVFLVGFDGMRNAIQLGEQFLDVKRLGDVVGRAEFGGLDGRLDGAVLRQHDDRAFGILRADLLQQFQSADLRHLQVA